MDIQLKNSEGLYKELQEYLRTQITSDEAGNAQAIRTYFGDRRYERSQIQFTLLNPRIETVSVSADKPYHIEKVTGFVHAGGKHLSESAGGRIGIGFMVNVRFSVEIGSASQGFANLRFSR
jgi:hypothetical protein